MNILADSILCFCFKNQSKNTIFFLKIVYIYEFYLNLDLTLA